MRSKRSRSETAKTAEGKRPTSDSSPARLSAIQPRCSASCVSEWERRDASGSYWQSKEEKECKKRNQTSPATEPPRVRSVVCTTSDSVLLSSKGPGKGPCRPTKARSRGRDVQRGRGSGYSAQIRLQRAVAVILKRGAVGGGEDRHVVQRKSTSKVGEASFCDVGQVDPSQCELLSSHARWGTD